MNHSAYDAALAALERTINDPSFLRLHGRPRESLSVEEQALLDMANAQADALTQLRLASQRQAVTYHQA
ncbi:MAG: hypothetical protein ACFB20_06995 [Opitutales bacterium]